MFWNMYAGDTLEYAGDTLEQQMRKLFNLTLLYYTHLKKLRAKKGWLV